MYEFFAMGGYGMYVWSAYGVCMLGLLGYACVTRYLLKEKQHTLKRLSQNIHN